MIPFWRKTRLFLITLLVGKESMIFNCNINSGVLCEGIFVVVGCTFETIRNPKDRKEGITIKPFKKSEKSIGIKQNAKQNRDAIN